MFPADKYDPDVIQVWRSLAAEAVFEMNGDVDVDTLAGMLSTARRFGDTLMALFPEDSGPLLGGDGRRVISEIIETSRALSFKIQHGVVSSRMVVTLGEAENSLGTWALGLDRIGRGGRTVLVRPKSITLPMVHRFHPRTNV